MRALGDNMAWILKAIEAGKEKGIVRAGPGTEDRQHILYIEEQRSCDPARRACIAVQHSGCYNKSVRIPLRCGGKNMKKNTAGSDD